jgi:hypothetical protein
MVLVPGRPRRGAWFVPSVFEFFDRKITDRKIVAGVRVENLPL